MILQQKKNIKIEKKNLRGTLIACVAVLSVSAYP